MKNKARLASIDVVRTIAIVSMVLLHLHSNVLPAGSRLALLARSFGLCGVPFFVMLTGYLMVGRDYEGAYLGRFVRHNLLPLVMAFEIWNLAFAALGRIPDLYWEIPLDSTLRNALFAGASDLDELWFLPMMIALYLGLPIISMALKRFSQGEARPYGLLLMGLLVYFGTVLPTVASFSSQLGLSLGVTPLLNLGLFGAEVWGGCVWTLYLVLGWMIRRGVFRRIPSWGVILFLIVGVACHLGVIFRFNSWDTGGAYCSMPMVIIATTVFELLDRIEHLIPDLLARAAAFVSQRAFGVFVIHIWVMNALLMVCEATGFSLPSLGLPTVGYLVALLCSELIVLALSLCVTELLSRSKVIRRWALLMK